MSYHPGRDYYITVAVAQAEPLAEVAAAHGLHPTRIQIIARENAWMIAARDGRPVPPGLTIRAAIALHHAIGIWPTEGDAPEIASRRMEILRCNAGRRIIREDVERWMRYLCGDGDQPQGRKGDDLPHKGEQPEEGWRTDFRADFSTVSAAGSVEGVWVQVAIIDSKGREARILITEEEALHLYRVAIETRAIERRQSQGRP